MEDLNNFETINNPITENNLISPKEQPLQPKPNNTFKILFFVTFLFLIGATVVIFILIQKLNEPSQQIITKTNNQIEESIILTATETVTPTVNETATQQITSSTENNFYENEYLSLVYPDNWTFGNNGQPFFYPEEYTIDNFLVESDRFFRIFIPGPGHGGAAACYESVDENNHIINNVKRETVYYGKY